MAPVYIDGREAIYSGCKGQSVVFPRNPATSVAKPRAIEAKARLQGEGARPSKTTKGGRGRQLGRGRGRTFLTCRSKKRPGRRRLADQGRRPAVL